MHRKTLHEYADEWWSVALRGLLAVVAGIAIYLSPIPHTDHLLRVFGVYMIVDGLIELFITVQAVRQRQDWLRPGINGVLGVVFGLFNVVGGGLPAVVRADLVAVRTFISGISSFLLARQVRTELPADLPEWLLQLTALASIVFGVIIFVGPAIEARIVGELDWLTALYLIDLGLLLLVIAARLRAVSRIPAGAATHS
ncbi:MAG: HdeD family acid-resistance protein [Ktedonobacterales bacterium]